MSNVLYWLILCVACIYGLHLIYRRTKRSFSYRNEGVLSGGSGRVEERFDRGFLVRDTMMASMLGRERGWFASLFLVIG